MTSRGLPLGGSINFSEDTARAKGDAWFDTVSGRSADQPRQVNVARADYSAPQGSTSQVPTSPTDGVESPYGRVWAEGRSLTSSSGSGSFGMTLISSQNGVRCLVAAPPGQTVTGGSVRFWTFDPLHQTWALGGVDETLPTGAAVVATTDQFNTVGAQ
jgi:hypothetical protein